MKTETRRVDLKKDLRHLYRASSKKVTEVEVQAFQFLMVDGEGDPNSSRAYAEAVEALFSVSYTAKFMIKRSVSAIDYAVMPLEGLWWADDMSAFESNDKSKWKWTMMIMQPDFVEPRILQSAVDAVRKRKGLSAVDNLRVESYSEGHCAQILHIGPFENEGATIRRLHEYIASESELTGRHHEIYLTDIRRSNPANWKTIIRQPIA